jgi:hypothetical protein
MADNMYSVVQAGKSLPLLQYSNLLVLYLPKHSNHSDFPLSRHSPVDVTENILKGAANTTERHQLQQLKHDNVK